MNFNRGIELRDQSAKFWTAGNENFIDLSASCQSRHIICVYAVDDNTADWLLWPVAGVVLAIELLAACQAMEFLRPLTTTAPLEAVYKLVRAKIPSVYVLCH